MRAVYVLVVFLGFATTLPLESYLNDEKIKEALSTLNLHEIKDTLSLLYKKGFEEVLSQYNVDQLKKHLAETNDEKSGFIESIILELLETVRQIMRNGTDSIPVLDPITIESISLGDSNLPSSSYVSINNLTIKDISTFEVEELKLSTVWFRQRLDFNFVIPAVIVNASSYDMSFTIFGGNIFGKGDMNLAIEEPRISGYLLLGVRFGDDGIFLIIHECRIQVGLEAFKAMITGMFNDQTISDFIAAFLRNLIPELLSYFEEDITNILSLIVLFVGNIILAGVDIGGLIPTP